MPGELRELLREHGAPPDVGLLAVAGAAALEGGRAALPYYGSERLRVRDKGGDDPVTSADHAANAAILARLSADAAGVPVLSEESPPPAGELRAGPLWVVDPLDGTKEFIAENGEFAVMVGLSRGGRCALGAVFRPDPGALYLGRADGGAWIWEDPADPSTFRPLRVPPAGPGPLRLVQSRSHPDERTLRLAELLGDVELVHSGSVGVKCVLVATGAADLYVHPVPYLKEWDTCAPEAVLRGAGGRVGGCTLEPLDYGKAGPEQPLGIAAFRPDLEERVLERILEVGREFAGRADPPEHAKSDP